MALDTEAEKALLSSGNANKDLVADRSTKNRANFFDLFFFDISKKTQNFLTSKVSSLNFPSNTKQIQGT